MNEFRVVDIHVEDGGAQEILVNASSPEAAARKALGIDLVRSGAKRDLRAKVYFQHPGQSLSMVRLYAKVNDRVAAVVTEISA